MTKQLTNEEFVSLLAEIRKERRKSENRFLIIYITFFIITTGLIIYSML